MAVGDNQKLITKIVSQVLGEPAHENIKFDWLINKHFESYFNHHYPIIDKIFNQLNGDRDGSKQKRLRRIPCDAYFGGNFNFIFEFDEFQHFSSAREIALNNYPKSIKLNFGLLDWQKRCFKYKTEADNYRKSKKTTDFKFVGGRTAQRAYLDSFRDLLPETQGLNPTLRINEFEVLNIENNNKDAFKKIEKLLNNKLS